jgi:hypothetical protein
VIVITIVSRNHNPVALFMLTTLPERLQFLDQTLMGMIKRFEDEFPETRLPETVTSPPLPDPSNSSPSDSIDIDLDQALESRISDTEQPLLTDDEEGGVRPVLSRHNSDVSIASRALAQEEGRMHRYSQKVRRDILKPSPDSPSPSKPSQSQVEEPRHIQMLRSMIEGIEGEEIKKLIEQHGEERVMMEMNSDASQFRQMLIDNDPEGFEIFRQSMEAAQRNRGVGRGRGLSLNVEDPGKGSGKEEKKEKTKDDKGESAVVD